MSKSFLLLYTVSGKKEATIFSTINLATIGGFSYRWKEG